MNLESQPPPIPIGRPISFEDWLKGRRWRREIGNRVAPEFIRRSTGPNDRRLKEWFGGDRGPAFTPTDQIPRTDPGAGLHVPTR